MWVDLFRTAEWCQNRLASGSHTGQWGTSPDSNPCGQCLKSNLMAGTHRLKPFFLNPYLKDGDCNRNWWWWNPPTRVGVFRINAGPKPCPTIYTPKSKQGSLDPKSEGLFLNRSKIQDIQTPKSRLSGFGVWGFAAQPFRMCCTTMLTSVVVYKFLDARLDKLVFFKFFCRKSCFPGALHFQAISKLSSVVSLSKRITLAIMLPRFCFSCHQGEDAEERKKEG